MSPSVQKCAHNEASLQKNPENLFKIQKTITKNSAGRKLATKARIPCRREHGNPESIVYVELTEVRKHDTLHGFAFTDIDLPEAGI
jgi:hypothetical protein